MCVPETMYQIRVTLAPPGKHDEIICVCATSEMRTVATVTLATCQHTYYLLILVCYLLYSTRSDFVGDRRKSLNLKERQLCTSDQPECGGIFASVHCPTCQLMTLILPSRNGFMSSMNVARSLERNYLVLKCSDQCYMFNVFKSNS